MNKTIAIVGGVIIILIVGGFVFYSINNKTNIPVDDTATAPVTNTNSVQVRQSGNPIVVTGSKVIPMDTTAVVTGTVTPNGALTSYWYEYGTTANLGTNTSKQSVGSGYVSISAPAYITGLTKDTTYYFQLVAENQNGKVTGTNSTFLTTRTNPIVIGGVPKATTLDASEISKNTASLNGEVTPNKTNTQYWFEYGKTSELGETTSFISAGDGSEVKTVSTSISKLERTTTYYFRINAQNQFGTYNGTIISFETK